MNLDSSVPSLQFDNGGALPQSFERIQRITSIATDLIGINSVDGTPDGERRVAEYLRGLFLEIGWVPEVLQATSDRYVIFVQFGNPEIVFSSHFDVVPALPEQFEARIEGDLLYGRGACDAKGIIATMIRCSEELLQAGKTDFGLLFVGGEETDGIGAKYAATALKGRGIKYIVNGEPTEGKLAIGQRGAIDFNIKFSGRSCHSGFPHLGDDANRKALDFATALVNTQFPTHPTFGSPLINIGVIHGGTKANQVSDECTLSICVRTCCSHDLVREQIVSLAEEGSVTIGFDAPPCVLLGLDGFEHIVYGAATDVPNFAALGAQALLFGPGSISVAHTNHESVALSDLYRAVDQYMDIYTLLRACRVE